MNTPPKQSFIRSYWGIILAAMVVVGLLILVLFAMIRQQNTAADRASSEQRKSAPDFTLTTFDKQTYSLKELRGKVVVLNFWASWCLPCEEEAAELEQAWRYYQPGGEVIFLGVAWTDTESAALDYLKRFDITYPNGPDLRTRISQAYRTSGVPETYIIDKNGNLTHAQIGPFASFSDIQEVIEPLLSP